MKECNVTLIYYIQFFFPYCHFIPYLIRHILSNFYAPILLIFHPFLKTKQAALVASKHSKCGGGDVEHFTLSEPSRYRPVRTRSVTSNFLVQQRRRNGTETWWRRSCLCEHLHLITNEKILLKSDFPPRNGNVKYSVNQPLGGPPCTWDDNIINESSHFL